VFGAAVDACWVSRCSGMMTGCPACTPNSVMIGISSRPNASKVSPEAQISKVCGDRHETPLLHGELTTSATVSLIGVVGRPVSVRRSPVTSPTAGPADRP